MYQGWEAKDLKELYPYIVSPDGRHYNITEAARELGYQATKIENLKKELEQLKAEKEQLETEKNRVVETNTTFITSHSKPRIRRYGDKNVP